MNYDLLASTNTVQNNYEGISNENHSYENSKIETKQDSLLEPVNAVADIDTIFLDEGLEVNIM